MKHKSITVHTPEESAAYVAKLRAEGLLPPRGKSHEYVPKEYNNVIKQQFSGIGDCVKTSFADYAIEFDPGCSCKALKRQLNYTSPDAVNSEIDDFVNRVAANVRHAKGWRGAILKAINWAYPDAVKSEIRNILTKCINDRQAETAKDSSTDSSIPAQDAPSVDQ